MWVHGLRRHHLSLAKKVLPLTEAKWKEMIKLSNSCILDNEINKLHLGAIINAIEIIVAGVQHAHKINTLLNNFVQKKITDRGLIIIIIKPKTQYW